MSEIAERANQWIVGSDTGSSSKCLWATMMGVANHKSHPHDGGDFGRCHRLLELIPEWRPRLGEMRAVSPYWDALVERWDEITKRYLADLDDGRRRRQDATYDLMRSILDPIQAADPRVITIGRDMTVEFR